MVAVRRKKVLKHIYQDRYLLLMIIPAVVWYVIFAYLPMYGVTLAFKKFDYQAGIWGSPWAGMVHFERLFRSTSNFGRVLRNTVIISLLKLAFVFTSGIILALLINEIPNGRFKKITQTISYLPHFLSWVIIGSILTVILSPSTGVVNHLLGLFGIKPIFFLADVKWFRTVLIASDVWQSMGWGSIIYLAAIAGIDPALYEAATIDGAGRLTMMVKITIPCIANVITIMLILSLGQILNAGFDQVMNLYNLRVYEVADIIDTYVYRVGINDADYSFATAVGLFKNVVGLVLVVISQYVAKKMGNEGLW